MLRKQRWSGFWRRPSKRRKKTSSAPSAWKQPSPRSSCVQTRTSSALNVRPRSRHVPSAGWNYQLPWRGDFHFFLFLFYSLSFLFAKAPLCWENCHVPRWPAAEAGGTDWRLDWTGERSSNVTWCLSNSISFFIFNNHLQSKVVMMTHITKISLCHIFSQCVFCRSTAWASLCTAANVRAWLLHVVQAEVSLFIFGRN